MKTTLTVLHLSDLHFGIEPGGVLRKTALAQRKLILDALVRALSQLDTGWHPDIVVVSGDVGWRGLAKDYVQAEEWLRKLLEALELSSDRLVVSAGNHDFDRALAIGRGFPLNAAQADEWLDPGHLEKMGEPFSAYKDFYTSIGLPPLQLADYPNPLVGAREIEWLRFVVLNSAWFSLNNKDKGHLWMGRPQLDVMAAAEQLPRPHSYDEDLITIAVLHHPSEWFVESEIHSYDTRPATYHTLARHSHLILHGHVHAGPASPNRIVNSAWTLTGGATYAGGDYRNHVNLIQIERRGRSAIKRPLEYDPRSERWSPHDDEPFPLTKSPPKPGPQAAQSGGFRLDNWARLQTAARLHAERYLERKSLAIAQGGRLPTLIERTVAVHGREERLEPRDGQIGRSRAYSDDSDHPFRLMATT